MRALLKTLLCLTLSAAFLLTGCDTAGTSSETSSDVSETVSSAISDTGSAPVSSEEENSDFLQDDFFDIPEGTVPDVLSKEEYITLEKRLIDEYIPKLGLVLSYCEWSNAEEIPIEALIDWYRSNNMDSKTVSAENFESAVQKYFYISKSRLRNSQYFNEDINAYRMKVFYDTFIDFRIEDIKQYGKTVKTQLVCTWLGRERFAVDTLVELTVYAENDEVKFVKCLNLGSTDEFSGKSTAFSLPVINSDLGSVNLSAVLPEGFSVSADGKKLLLNGKEIGNFSLFGNEGGSGWNQCPINPLLSKEDCFLLCENIKLDIITYPLKYQENTRDIGYAFYVNFKDVYLEVFVSIDMSKPQESADFICQAFNIAKTVSKT